MKDLENYRIDTKCIQAGYDPKDGEPRVMPIVQSTTYKYESAETMGKLFNLEEEGFFYTRLGNPTLDAVEKKIASLEGGVGAMLTSSGQAAALISITNIAHSGDHVVCTGALYGGTFNLFNKTLRELGIEFTFLPPNIKKKDLNNAFRDNTRCVFIESLCNPSLVIPDVEFYATAAHEHGVPLIVDNTFPTPINCRPFDHGADIIIHSTTKYMDGHGVALGGAIVDSGNFLWDNGKFPEFTEPDESYHGTVYWDTFKRASYIVKARVHLMRDFGAQQSPQNAFLLNLGLETLALRMKKHCENALYIATYLSTRAEVEEVNYPDLPGNRYHKLSKKYMPNGTCGVISFSLKGGREAACKFMESLKLAAIVVHVADVRTCILHPASTTHRQLTDEQLTQAGIAPNMLRMSVGIENKDDILDDIKQALEQI